MLTYNNMVEQLSSLYSKSLAREVVDMQLRGEKAGPALRGHIVNVHFSPDALAWLGVARFDIDLAKRMGMPLDWVVKKGIELLENGWDDPNGDLGRIPGVSFVVYRNSGLPWGEDWCKSMIVKNLIYIEQLGTARVDWDRVVAAVPNARSIALDIDRDSFDPFATMDHISSPQNYYFKEIHSKEIISENNFQKDPKTYQTLAG